LPRKDADVAVRIADDLRCALELARVPGAAGVTVRYTVSVGAASLAPGEMLAGLLQRADAALYAAKRAGRNRVGDARVTAMDDARSA
jgi:diguanylate cyclase (GGDEF)-like protein